MSLDFEAIRERFVTEWNDAVPTYFANEEAEDPDESQPYVRFSINPGNEDRYLGGEPPTYSQLGRIWLQIFMPKNYGTVDGYDLADAFKAIFRKWKSDDGCVRTSAAGTQSFPVGENGMFMITVSIAYESLRRV